MNKTAELEPAERTEIESAINVYLGAGKRWRREDYRVEHRGPSADGKHWIITAVHADDEAGLAPGGGKSLELWSDRKTKQVVKELGFQ